LLKGARTPTTPRIPVLDIVKRAYATNHLIGGAA